MEKSSGRRWFLKSVAAVGVAVPAGALGADPQSHHGHGEHVAQAGAVKGQSQPQVYGWLTQPEQAFIEAAVARLIPADELGPGAKEAGVSYFIDQQLAGAYGTMARNYRQGPWPEGTPQQGYQSRLASSEALSPASGRGAGPSSRGTRDGKAGARVGAWRALLQSSAGEHHRGI